MKFKDFTDSGQLKIRLMSHWFVAVVLPSQVFLILVRERVGGFKEDLRFAGTSADDRKARGKD